MASIARSRSRASFLDDDDDARHDHSRDHLRHRGDAAARAHEAQRRAPDAVRCGEGVRPVTVRVTTIETTMRCDGTTMGWDGNVRGWDLWGRCRARRCRVRAGRVRRACEGGRGGGIYGAYVRVARWRVRGADAGVDGRGVDGVRDPGARDGDRAGWRSRDGVVTARGRAWRGVGWRARGRWREVRVARAGAGAAPRRRTRRARASRKTPRGDKMIGEIGFGLTRARRDVETRMRDGSSRGVDVVNCARGKGC